MRSKGKATIRDVCQLSGLSVGVVSKYLNGGSLKANNRQLVEDAIKKLDYTVDEYARAMVTGKTNTIGVLLPELDNAFYGNIVTNIEKALDRAGYAVIVRGSWRDAKKEREGIDWFISRRVDAIIMVPCCNKSEDYGFLDDLGIPVLFFDMWVKGANVEHVIVNNRDVSFEGVKLLLDNGHKDIAIVCAPKGVYTADRRLQGYLDAYADRNLTVDESLIYRVQENVDEANAAIKELLTKRRCSALFASNLTAMYGALFAINELKRNVPADISLLGFDDMMFTKIFQPKLTIINQPIEQIAQVAAARIRELIEQGGEYTYRKNYMKSELILGDSIADIRG